MEKRKTARYIAAYLLLVLALWMLFTLLPHPEAVILEQQSGVLDLRAASFDDTVYHYFDNFWENYPEALLTPEDFAGPDAPTPRAMHHEDYRVLQYATHRMQMRLLPGRVYALSMKSSDYAMRFFIDGMEVGAVGHPGASPEENVPGVARQTYFFTPTEELTTLVAQTANWVHEEGAFAPNFYLGAAGDIAAHERHTLRITHLITGVLLTAFLYHLGLYVLNRHRIVTLVFALDSLLLAVMQSGLYHARPEANWYAMFRLEYIVHFLVFAGLCLFFQLLFPQLLHRAVTRAYYVLAGLFILSTFLLSTRVYSTLILFFHIVSVAMIVYLLLRLAMQLRERKPQNALAFIGASLLCFFGVNDLFYSHSILNLGKLFSQVFATPTAMAFFVFCYALVVALEYADTEQAMNEARRNEMRLSADNAALDRLNHMKTELIATVTHETMTPLAVLSGYAELVAGELRRKNVDEQTARDLDNIAEETQRIAGLMDELHSHTRERESSHFKTRLALTELIDGAARLYRPILARGHTALTLNVPEDLPDVYACAPEITQVLFNLLQNARNHTEAGAVTLSAAQAGDFVCVTVADTGEGIPAALLPEVFTRGVSGQEGGSGLGLPICKEILAAHEGAITIESEAGRGTAVRFTLPLWKEALQHGAADGAAD